MSAARRYGMRSLRFKLVLASVAVEMIMLTVLVWNSTRITGDAMQEIFQNRIDTLVPLMNVSLASPLVQRDYATLDDRLGRIVRQDSLAYIEVRDELGTVVASRGEIPETARLDVSFKTPGHVYNQTFDITLAGRVIGRAHYGINVSLLQATLTNLRNQGALVASIEIILTVLLLATLGALLTRHLRTMAQAARTLADGDYVVRIPVVGRDEVADTAQAFNTMSDTLARDLAKRRRAEQELKQSEQRLRNIIDGLGPSMFVGLLTTEGVVLEANQQALAAAGLKPEDVLGKPIEETYWFSYSEASKQQMRETIARAARGEASRYDLQIHAAENQFIPLDFSVQPFRDASGKVVLLVPSAIVIAERKRAEESLQESEERLRLALDAAHMGTFDWDVPNNHITWSRWHEELWGFKPGEFGGTYEAFSERVHPDDLPEINAETARCITEREPYVGEFRVIWPDGSTHWIAARGEFTFDASGVTDQPLRMRGAAVEITERKQAEITLRGEKRVMGMMVEGALLSETLDVITRNVEAMSSGTLCSILLLDADGVHLRHGAAPSLPEDYNRAIHGGEIGPRAGSCGTAVYRNQPVIVTDIATDPLWDDYRELALSHGLRACWSTPIQSTGGRVLGSFALYYREPRAPGPADFEFIARMTQLTAIAIERRRAEQELQENSQQLEILSRRLLAAQETERRHIARELHDEIGQLLTVIKLDLQTVLRQPGTSALAPALKEGMESVDRVVTRVRDLSLDLRPSMLDDLGLVPTLRWYVQRQMLRLGVDIALKLPPSLPRLASEIETACFRIVQEALTNIARHASATHIEVTVTLAIPDGNLILTVHDDGQGFDVSVAHRTALAGGGFGLLGMQERAELAGGIFHLASGLGQGATIEVRFPLPDPERETKETT